MSSPRLSPPVIWAAFLSCVVVLFAACSSPGAVRELRGTHDADQPLRGHTVQFSLPSVHVSCLRSPAAQLVAAMDLSRQAGFGP